ncbi:MAG TPA: hypothetical protein VM571_08460 [Noviherbaspirillum sp.]|nr:hypothetical protein [Noviherbaspirillum sp.]
MAHKNDRKPVGSNASAATHHDPTNKEEARHEIVNCGKGCAYRILDLIGTTASSSLYRALSLQDDKSAVLSQC